MKKSNEKVFVYVFWILIIFIIYAIFTILKTYAYKYEVIGLNGSLKPISINFELKKKYDPDELLLCFNDYCKIPEADYFKNVYSFKFDKTQEEFFETKVKNIYLAYPVELKDFKKDIKNIDLSVGIDNHYYSNEDISSFEEKEFSVEFDEDLTEKYRALILPEINNYKGLIEHCLILFMSLFYHWTLFIIPYFWLFVAILIYAFNKEKFNFKLNKKILLGFLSVLISFVIIIPLSAYLKKDDGTDNFINFVEKDSKKYGNDYAIHAVTSKKPQEADKIQWHYADKNSIKTIKKDDYAPNDKKAVIYFNSNEADVQKAFMFNPKAYIYKTNSSTNAKIIYE